MGISPASSTDSTDTVVAHQYLASQDQAWSTCILKPLSGSQLIQAFLAWQLKR